MRLALVGGGTGGHFYPLIAVAESLREQEAAGVVVDLYYLGPDPYNAEALAKQNIKFVRCPAGKNRLYRSIWNYLDIFKTGWGIVVAFMKLLRLYPDAVLSKGGYTSVPVVIAAWLLRIPIVVHESDAVPGRANLLAARFARTIALAHEEAAEFFKGKEAKLVNVGMPIRRSFRTTINNPHELLGIQSDKPVILVTGGSSGAERLNNFIIASLPRLLTDFTVVHQVGDANVEGVSATASALFSDREPLSRYFVFGHLSEQRFAAALQAAALVVSRAGSTTLFEIAAAGKPAIVVPIPEDISRDQRSNAYAYARVTGAVVLEEHNLSDDILVAEITRILKSPEIINEMTAGARSLTASDGAYKLADILTTIGREHEI